MKSTESDNRSPDKYNQAIKHPMDNSLSSQLKQKIKKLIEKDNLIQLIVLLDSQKIPLFAEISSPNSRWMMTHFCCRWDANNSLEFLLKNYFVNNPTKYIDFVNSTTTEGWTPLHLCSIWKAQKCFKVLQYYGGLNLKCEDKNKNTALKCALKSRCTNISNCLNEYKNMKIDFTKVQGQKLTSGDVISLKASNKDANILKYIEIKQQPNTIPQEQKKLVEIKMILQYAINQIKQDQIQSEFKCVQQKKQNEAAIILQQQKFENDLKKKFQETLREQRQKYQAKLKQKQDQLQKLKAQLKEMEQKRISQQRMQAQRLAQIFAKEQQQKLKQLAKNQEEKISELKKQQVPPPVEEVSQIVQNPKQNNPKGQIFQSFKAIHQQVPPEILQLYQNAQKNGKFTDLKFPAAVSSIGNQSSRNFKYFKDNIIWQRPSQIFKGKEYQLFDGIDPNDIQQGQLGICYMLATISSLAAKPSNIQKLFVFSDLKLGFYVLRLYIHGKPTYFTIDDQIPCNKNTKYPIFTKPVGNQLWVMLIQKCWAKAIGSYLGAEVMTPNLIMEDLSGAPGFGGWLQGPHCKLSIAQNIKMLQNHSNLGHPIVITSSDKKIQGIVNGHAYTLMNVFKVKDKYIFKIRNPWGKFQWQGQYGQKSRFLTPQIKKAIGYTPDNDGIFFLSQSQLVRAFDYYSISILIDNHEHSYTQFTSKSKEDRFFKFTLSKSGYSNVRISQRFSRMVDDPNYKYSSAKFQVGKIQNNNVKCIAQGDSDIYHGAKSINFSQNVCEQLQAGDYFVRINMLWANQQKCNSAVLSVYASQKVEIQPLDEQTGIQYMRLLFYSHSKPIPRSPINQYGYYKINTMKGQFVLIAQTDLDGEYEIEFKLIADQVVGVQLALGKVQQLKIRLPLTKDKPAVGSASIIAISKGGTTGPVYMTLSKL